MKITETGQHFGFITYTLLQFGNPELLMPEKKKKLVLEKPMQRIGAQMSAPLRNYYFIAGDMFPSI